MKYASRRVPVLFLAAVLSSGAAAAAQSTPKPLPPSEMVPKSLLKTRIDTNCAVVHSAVKTAKGKDFLLSRETTWQLVNDDDVAVAERRHTTVTYAKVWKQAGNLAWVHWISEDAKGNKHATQLCFRNDGSLARARQATTVPGLDSAVARQAYYYTNGTLIEKTELFAIDDPALYKRVKDLPFFGMTSH